MRFKNNFKLNGCSKCGAFFGAATLVNRPNWFCCKHWDNNNLKNQQPGTYVSDMFHIFDLISQKYQVPHNI